MIETQTTAGDNLQRHELLGLPMDYGNLFFVSQDSLSATKTMKDNQLYHALPKCSNSVLRYGRSNRTAQAVLENFLQAKHMCG